MLDNRRRIWMLLLAGWASLAACFGCGKEETGADLAQIQMEDSQAAEEEETEPEPKEVRQETVFVYVCGQVAVPGVYELPAGSRICDAIEAAGGLTENGAGEFVNHAEELTDGAQIYLPSVEETQGMTPGQSSQGPGAGSAAEGRVNINSAGKEELMTLTGIGEKRAEAIIEYRESSGGFQSVDELMNVPGIKEGTFAKIKEEIIL